MSSTDGQAVTPAEHAPGPCVPPYKTVRIYVILGLIFFVTGTYVGVDWASYFYPFPNVFSPYAGYLRTILCVVLALMTREHNIEGASQKTLRDGVLLITAFLLTGVADVFLLLLDWMTVGTGIFLLVHLILTARHATRASLWLRGPRPAKDVGWLAVTAVIIGGGTAVFFTRVRGLIEPTGQLGLFSVYLAVLAISLWTAFSTKVNPFFPRENALQIMIGMACLYLCDITVGLAFVLQGSVEGLILNNLIAFFYTPALVLLALSGYSWADTFMGVLPSLPSSGLDERLDEGRDEKMRRGTVAQALPPNPGE